MIKRFRICLVIVVTDIDCAKISLVSYLSKNLRDRYDIHILTQADFDFSFLSKYGNVSIYKDSILEHLYSVQTYKNIILLNEKTFCLKEIDSNFSLYRQYQMTGYLKYPIEFDIAEYKIPFVTGVFSDGFMFLSNLKFSKDDPVKFRKTFKYFTDDNFVQIFLSWLCTKKLKVNDVSAETRYYHSATLDDLKLIYFCEDQPWKQSDYVKLPYIYKYLDKYCSFAQQLNCSETFVKNLKNIKINSIDSDFQEDLKYKYTYRTPYHVFIPLCERELRIKLYG